MTNTHLPHQDVEPDEAPELDADFFASAILTRPGESVVDTVQAARAAASVPQPKNGSETTPKEPG